MRNPFRRGYEVTLNRVHDTINVNENGEILTLTVCADPMRIVAGLTKAQKKLTEIVDKQDATDEELAATAEYFASVIFGTEQAQKLMAFYAGDAACVINVCGKYFKERLSGKISKIQKKTVK